MILPLSKLSSFTPSFSSQLPKGKVRKEDLPENMDVLVRHGDRHEIIPVNPREAIRHQGKSQEDGQEYLMFEIPKTEKGARYMTTVPLATGSLKDPASGHETTIKISDHKKLLEGLQREDLLKNYPEF